MINHSGAATPAVSLTLNRSIYTANDLVQGSIRITAYQRFECTSILVIALGLETIRWKADPRSECLKARQNVCFKQEIMVSAAERVFDLGEHSCTFECVLPLVLPGSVQVPGIEEITTASIEYRFEVIVEFFPLVNEVLSTRHQKRHVRTAQPFLVHETHPELVPIFRFDEVTGVPTQSCCRHRAVCDLKASIPTDTYYQGEPVHVALEVTSSSLELELPELTIRLLQIVKIRLNTYEQVMEREVSGWQFGPIRLYSHTPQVFALDGLSPRNDILSPSTTNGTVVQCRYAIDIDGTLANGVVVQLRIPITLLSSLHRIPKLQ